MIKTAIYAGTFDPITNGHLWMIEAGAKVFDELIVAIGTNPDKKTMFTLTDRMNFIEEASKNLPNVKIDEFTDEFLVRYAKTKKANFILRGIRNESDFLYERVLRNLNADADPKIITVFLIPPRELAEVSSSIIKGFLNSKGWESMVKRYVPLSVFDKFCEMKRVK